MRKEFKYGIYCQKNEMWVSSIRVGRLYFVKEPSYSNMYLSDIGPAKGWLSKNMKATGDNFFISEQEDLRKYKQLDAGDFISYVLSCEVKQIEISLSIGETVFKKMFKP
jgi:hypothetical protein